MIDQFTTDPLAPDDQFNPLNLRYKRKLSSLVGATGSPGASTLGSFSPDDDQSWGGSRFYGSLPDEAAFNVSSAGAAGQGVSGQPEVVRNKPPEPRAPAGRVLAAKMPPPGIPAQPPVEPAGSAAPPAPVQSQPQSAPSTPQSTPPAGAADQFSSQAQQVAQRMAARKPPEMKTNWAQRLGLAVLSVSRLAPYAQQIVHPKWAAETAQYNAQQKQDVDQLKALESAENIASQHELRGPQAKEAEARAQYLTTQAKILEEEGKRAPKGNYIPFGKGGIFDASEGKVVVQPTEINPGDIMEIDPEKGKALGIVPGPDGKYILPKEGIAPFLSGQAKPPSTEANKQRYDEIVQKVIAEGVMPPGAATDINKLQAGIKSAKTITPDERNFALTQSITRTSPAATATSGILRIEALGQTRGVAMLDTKKNNTPVEVPWTEISRANAEEPGRYVPLAGSEKALNKTALLEDIRGNVNQVRQSLQSLPDFDTMDKAKIAVALRSRDPKGTINAMINSGALSTMTPAQQEYIINVTNLIENAMAMRSVLGAGQGSEDLRSAITSTIPGPTTPSRDYALKQLDTFEKVLDRLSRGVPNIPLRTDIGVDHPPIVQHSPSTGQYRYSTDGGKTWHPGQPPK